MKISESEWFARKIIDYWDQLQVAIEKYAARLSAIPPADRPKALAEIRECVIEHAGVLPDKQMVTAAFVMTDDLYKSVSHLSRWDECLPDYLSASANTICELLAERGYVIQYVTDNTYKLTEVGMSGPRDYFAAWFRSAGFIYICPQQLALRLMESDHRQKSEYLELLPSYIAEARDLANKLVDQCHAARRHFFFLDTDSTENSFPLATKQFGADHVLGVFRNEAPEAGSKIAVTYPKM